MKITTGVIAAVLIVAAIELAGLAYFIANYHVDSSQAPDHNNNNNLVNYTRQEVVDLALNNGTVKEYTSRLKYNISEVDESPGYVRIDVGNDTMYWASLSVEFDPFVKKIDYVRLNGLASFNLMDAGYQKPALFNQTVKERIGNKTCILAEVNRPGGYILFYIGDMITTCDQLKVGMDFKNDTVTYVQDLGPMALVLPMQGQTSAETPGNASN